MLSSTGQGRGIPVSEVERLAALQVGSPKLSLENVAYVLEHHKTTTVSTMSRALHMRWETLKHRMDEMGLTAFSTRQIWSKADLAKFRKLAKEGKTLEDLAEEFGRSIDSIRLTGEGTTSTYTSLAGCGQSRTGNTCGAAGVISD